MAAAIDQEDNPLNQLFSDLRYNTVDTVVVNMTVESSRRKSDWRALAGILGFTEKQVQLVQQDQRQPCKGRQLVSVWEDLGKSSLRKFLFALKEANMGECLKVIMQDPDLEEVDFEAVLKEYEELKANRQFRKEFPRISMDKFTEAFYPRPIRFENTPSFQSCHVPSSFDPALAQCEMRQNSSLTGYHPAAHKMDNQILDERSVFISYCPMVGFKHRKFNKQLCKLAEFLQNQGYLLHFEPNCQAQIRSCGGVVNWKEACIKRSKNILVICTSDYYNEDSKATESDHTRESVSKIAVDSRLLRQLAYSRENSRIIPVVMDICKPTGHQVPMWLQPLVFHSWPSGQSDLDLCLKDLPRYVLKKPDPSRRKRIEPIVIDFPKARQHKC